MDPLTWLLAIIATGLAVALVFALLGRASLVARAASAEARLDEASRAFDSELEQRELRHSDALAAAARLSEERVQAVRRERETLARELHQAQAALKDSFEALAARALQQSSEQLLQLAQERLGKETGQARADLDKRRSDIDALLKPLAESVAKTDRALSEIQRGWAGDRASLTEQLRSLNATNEFLRAETSRLVRALREPQVRGRYGEVQLRRVVELAGLREYCDFSEQQTQRDSDGAILRPDMVVKLPNGRELAVDAKANLKAYLDALEADTPEAAEARLRDFADGVAQQAAALSKKAYWKDYSGSPELVIMFVPGDQFVDAALAKRPDLLEFAASRRVLLASPSSLIALLCAVQVGYQEQRLAEQAQELRKLGRELHERAAVTFGHVGKLGAALSQAVDRYNEFAGSYERRLEPTLRKFEECGVKSDKTLPEMTPVTTRARGVEVQQNLLGS